MKLRYKIYLSMIVLAAVFLWGRCNRSAVRNPQQPIVLPSNDIEQIHVNPSNHTITIITPKGNETLTLPDRQSTIDIHKDGTTKVTAKQFGLECHPFTGVGYGAGFRAYLGADVLYFKKLDLGLTGISPSPSGPSDIRLGAFISYNFYSNTRISLGIDHKQTIQIALTFRL